MIMHYLRNAVASIEAPWVQNFKKNERNINVLLKNGLCYLIQKVSGT